MPNLAVVNPMRTTSVCTPAAQRDDRLGEAIRGALRRLRSPFDRVFPSRERLREGLIGRIGAVEIRRVAEGWALETCVKGDPPTARRTGLQRVADFLDRRAGTLPKGTTPLLATARPLLQSQVGSGRWRLQVPLAMIDTGLAAAPPRRGRVRLRPVTAGAIAVMRLNGTPTASALEEADATLRQTLYRTEWVTDGRPVIRIYRRPSWLSILGQFEIAVPVVPVQRL